MGIKVNVKSLPQAILAGAVTAILAAFPLSAFVALVYRFPIPFYGYEGGIIAALYSPMAVAFYLLVGGIFILGLLGVLAGLIAYPLGKPDGRRIFNWILAYCVVLDTPAIVLLAVWDKIYGPW